MSFFHEYFTQDRKKTLRSYSLPVNLARFDHKGWMTSEKDLWYIAEYIDQVKHYPIASASRIRTYRKVDPIEIRAGNLERWPDPR